MYLSQHVLTNPDQWLEEGVQITEMFQIDSCPILRMTFYVDLVFPAYLVIPFVAVDRALTSFELACYFYQELFTKQFNGLTECL